MIKMYRVKNVDYKSFLANFKRIACVMSVNLNEEDDNRYSVVDANDAYINTVVQNPEDFERNVPYTRYIPKAVNFEALCENCVQDDRPVHTYFDIEMYSAWMEVFLTPLVSDDPDKKMLLFSYEMNKKADIDKLIDISSETATNVIKTCLKLRETNDFQKAMDSVVKDIRKQCEAKGCCILLTDFEKKQYTLLSEDFEIDVGIMPDAAYRSERFGTVIETWPRLMHKSNCFIFSSEKEMEEARKVAPEWMDTLKQDGISSLVIYPLRSDNKTIGYIWAGNFNPEKTVMIKETLGLTAFILSAEIANDQNNRRIKIMSQTDMLTGVYNRNAMNNRISDEISGKQEIQKPFGVFFVDVNGLKTINDTQGHLAGDNLLKDVASVLNDIDAKNNEIYRVGGDEFMIIASATDRDEFEKLQDSLLKNSERDGRAHFAVGSCHSDEDNDIRRAMQKADARMYERKAEYYQRHPELEWHSKRR